MATVFAMASAPGSIVFEAAPLPMTVRNGATGEKHLIETMIAGVAVFDYDGDGWPDIFVANGAAIPDLKKTDASFSNRLFRNNHDGTFSDVTERAGLSGEGYSMGVAAADFDNDGHVDLFVTGVRANHLYRNRGDGTFEDVTASSGTGGDGKWSVSAGWFDFDNDGLLDLFVIRYVDWTPAADTFCGIPGGRQYCNPKRYAPLSNLLYRNLGNGKFEDVSARSGMSGLPGKGMGVAFGDIDGDGRPDVFVANDTMPNFLFHNEGGGKFREIAASTGVAYNENGSAISSMGADFRDYDNDGRDDIFLTALPDQTFPLFRNLGGGRFADMTYTSGIAKLSLPWGGWSAGMVDLDNDGRKDIFVAGGHVMDNAEISSARASRQPNLVFRNEGAGRFSSRELAGSALHRGAAFGDFNHDGKVDAVVTRLGEAPEVLWNRTPGERRHWIDLKLTGSRSNRDSIGAQVRIQTATGEQWNRVTASFGYGGSSDTSVHFGLGADAEVDRIDIAWPSGIKQTLGKTSVDRLLRVSEPAR